MSSKVGNKAHKDRCQRYKAEGRRELNKKRKQERHLRHMEKLKERSEKRKASGKEYKYDKERTEKKREDHIPIGTNINCRRNTEVAQWDSIMGKLNRRIEKEKKAEKLREASNQKKEE